ncbi:uncharacterized protein LOC123527260 [Mercenaria mercenaria]|uniref:uncharacterized protein LOC123527260 n=1 Tax=Mercenaria mercenaria TaxID=6596 RepID=UPI00234E64BD|nr:uncharacterized protein LOC123527260 [Mercenaria mercenaria]
MEDLLNALEYCFIFVKQLSYPTVFTILACVLHFTNMRQALAFLLPLVLISTISTEEKVVVTGESRFEYEYKVLQKLVQLEEGQSKLEMKLKEKESIIEYLNQELKEAHASLESLNDVIDTMEAEGSGGGETYIRWGRTTCPGTGTELVYEGYVGGSHYTHKGAAVNYLCLPKDPLWATYNDAAQSLRAFVYGAEYERPDESPTTFEHDVPCAVCLVKRAPVLMLPGRNDCYQGWTLEYHGRLVAGYYDHPAASEYVCLDEHPESIEGGNANENGKLFYSVEGRCGSLKCPPYVNGRELTCAVCSYVPYKKSRDNKRRHWTISK